jgi:hypothetical protein
MIAAADWLKATPLNEQPDKRKVVSRFVLDWVNGSPTVTVELDKTIMDFEIKNPGMLIIYMASSSRFVLANNYSKDMRAKQAYALQDMIAVYKAGAGIKKDKKMEKLIKSYEDGKLNEWLEENLKIVK